MAGLAAFLGQLRRDRSEPLRSAAEGARLGNHLATAARTVRPEGRLRMHVRFGHFRHHGEGEPPDGRLTETLGLEVMDDDDETILSVIVDPEREGYVVQIDRYESGPFAAVDASRERVMLRV